MSASTISIEQLAINTIRTLSMDGVQKANSGHPGTPMALAPVAYTLWNQTLRFDPAQPQWPARDRFVLSCGHASMLLYSLLHLAGVKKPDGSLGITLDNLQHFRQLGSPCAGHPEYGDAPGIETTTGPLGQGLGNSVGMAIAAKWFAARYNKPGYELFGYNVYALCGDGDMMEGVACEAASLAGHLKLNNLVWIYDDNHITIEGETELAFSENVGLRFEGLGWNVLKVADANDTAAISQALATAQGAQEKPTLIIVRSIIGYGAPHKQNTHGAHGAPLGEDEIKLAKKFFGWPEDAKFLVPDNVRANFAAGIGARGAELNSAWQIKFNEYKAKFAAEATDLEAIWSKKLPANWEAALPVFPADAKGLATRVSSGKVLNALAPKFPWLIGGSADLAPSTMTNLDGADMGSFSSHNYGGRNFHFGIREHGMAAACNGISLSGPRIYCATFFCFTDYMRPSMRLSAIMHQPVLYVLTHDSIGLGEDGPTHQPVEHLSAMRAIPRMIVLRPGDANEVTEAYRTALTIHDRPVSLVLSRQNVPTLDRTKYAPAAGAAKGAYVLADAPSGKPEVIIIGTGTELEIALKGYEKLIAAGVQARLVSMPSWELFDDQNQAYRDSVLPPAVTARVAVEAGIKQGWERYLGDRGRFVGMKSFGASAPANKLYEHFAITPDQVVIEAQAALGK
ncbi:MAG TPA: transketolase [Pirellulaceae bacterium]|nr:transketolase [Pirellulaceae bacterium]